MPNANQVVGGPWSLAQDCLIVQVQTFDESGFPNRLGTQYAPNVSTPLPAVDTYIYRVVPDTTKTTAGVTWYRLELTCYPAPGTLTNMPPGMQTGVPQVVLSNLVGPTDSTGTRAAVFQFIDSTKDPDDPSYLTTHFPSDNTAAEESMIANFKGVVVNMQVMNVDARRRAQVSTVRSEFFLRNNASAAIMVGAND